MLTDVATPFLGTPLVPSRSSETKPVPHEGLSDPATGKRREILHTTTSWK